MLTYLIIPITTIIKILYMCNHNSLFYYYIVFVVAFICSCCPFSSMGADVVYVQDSTLNEKISLWHNIGISKSLLQNMIKDGDILEDTSSLMYDDDISIDNHAADILGRCPYLLMYNSAETEFVILSPSYGTCPQCWRHFYIGVIPNKNINTHKYIKTDISHFYTESGIFLGMTRNDIITIKGIPIDEMDSILSYYYISPQLPPDSHEYLYYKRQNTGEMYMKIVLHEGIVVGIAYGYTET